jgi:hypothetical protein
MVGRGAQVAEGVRGPEQLMAHAVDQITTEHRHALVGVGHTWLLGSAAESPLGRKQDFGNLTAAVVWRF